MTSTLRVILEVGKKRRVVAGATDWPGLDRWGISEDDALDTLLVRRTANHVMDHAWEMEDREPGRRA